MPVSSGRPGPRPTPFGEWLTRERTGRGLTQEALAERAGVSRTHVRQLEAGGRPSRDMVARLAEGLSRGQDARVASVVYSGGMNAAFGASHELEALPAALRALLVERLAELQSLTPQEMDWLAAILRDALALRIRLKKGE